MKNKKLLELKDGYISEIYDDFDCYESGGCPTCGYDKVYISEIAFIIYDNNDNEKEWFRVSSKDYLSYRFSVSDLIKLFIKNINNLKEMTIDEFKIWIENELLG